MSPVPADQVVLSESAEETVRDLEARSDKVGQSVLNRIRLLRSALANDAQHGEVVRKQFLPRQLASKYGLENLFVEDLPSYWRLLYTVVRDGRLRFVVIVEIVTHRQYDKWFPGKGR